MQSHGSPNFLITADASKVSGSDFMRAVFGLPQTPRMTEAERAAWAQTSEAAALLAAIRTERPDCWHLRRNAWDNCRYPRFQGANAKAFRNLWEAERTKALDANDGETFRALAEHNPDDIIDALLNAATVPYTPVEFTDLGEGRARFAA